MGPMRKRPRTNPPKDQPSNATTKTSQTAAEELEQIAANIPLPETPVNGSSRDLVNDISRKVGKSESTKDVTAKGSWYGTWPRKSTPSTQIARETIVADKSPTKSSISQETSHNEPSKLSRPASMRLGKGKETLDVTMSNAMDNEDSKNSGATARNSSPGEVTKRKGSVGDAKPEQAIETVDGTKDMQAKGVSKAGKESTTSDTTLDSRRPGTASGWLGGWLGKPIEGPTKVNTDTTSLPKTEEPPKQNAETQAAAARDDTPNVVEEASKPTSWFGRWSTTAPPHVEKVAEEQTIIPVITKSNGEQQTSVPAMTSTSKNTTATGSSWAFWSSDNKKVSDTTVQPEESQGELAIAGKPSESKPQPAITTPLKADAKVVPSAKKGQDSPGEVTILGSEGGSAQPEASQLSTTPSQGSIPIKTQPPNLILPSVKNTYRLVENPSILQQIARLLLKSKQAPVKHVFLAKEPPKIKHALAIGVHGLFPAPLLRTVIGQPTGTSIKFANHAADAIRRWAESHGSPSCEIEKVALEGEGKIGDRVDNLWKLLLNWIEHVRAADFILIGCHSQGVPVAVMLAAKLIEFGVVSSARVGICAMAGVSLGPFSDYKSRLFSGSAGELFDFANPESTVSKRYEDSLKVCLKYGTRITYCGSIDDQLVSMESAIFSTVNHPYIFRAVFVDGRIHAPDFLSHLVGFALKLRNLGVSDHGLIRELSAPLAGSLYTGEGHSRLYDDGKVYDLATEFALGTTTVEDVPLQIQKYEILSNANPYVLPWIMRGLLEEEFVKTELDAETTELLKQFDAWKPSTKVLKDVKYRLEAVRSKL